MMKDKKYIFITGTSESGKSMISEYIANIYKDAIHIKIRDVIKRMYEEASQKLEYENWQEEFESTKREQFWELYLKTAREMAKVNNIIVMDTLRKKESLETLNKITNNGIMLLYIDAKFENRAKREYARLNKIQNITYEEVILNTISKDKEKENSGLKEILKYVQDRKLRYGYIINNNGSMEEFKKCIDEKIKGFLGVKNV